MGKDRPNTLMGSFTVVFNFAGVAVHMKCKMNSPFLTDFVRISKGSGDLKYKLAYIWKKTKNTIPVAPIIKRTIKRRPEEGKKKRSDIISKSYAIDKIQDPLVVE